MDSKMLDNTTLTLEEAGVVLDDWGNIDVAHYEAKAVEMRSEYLTQMFASWRSSAAHAIRGVFSAPVTRNV